MKQAVAYAIALSAVSPPLKHATHQSYIVTLQENLFELHGQEVRNTVLLY